MDMRSKSYSPFKFFFCPMHEAHFKESAAMLMCISYITILNVASASTSSHVCNEPCAFGNVRVPSLVTVEGELGVKCAPPTDDSHTHSRVGLLRVGDESASLTTTFFGSRVRDRCDR